MRIRFDNLFNLSRMLFSDRVIIRARSPAELCDARRTFAVKNEEITDQRDLRR
jgi:hypothetical protein